MMLEAKQQSHQARTPLAALEVHWPCMLCTGPCGATGVPPNLHTHCLELYPVQGHAGLHPSQLTSTYCLRKTGNSGPLDASLQGPGEVQECSPRSSMSAEARLCRQAGSTAQPSMQEGHHASARSPARPESLQAVKDSECRL